MPSSSAFSRVRTLNLSSDLARSSTRASNSALANVHALVSGRHVEARVGARATAALADQLDQVFGQLRASLRAKHPEGQALNLGNLTQALQAAVSLQGKKEIKPIVLDYDQTNLRMNVVDRGFLIWLENQDRNDLLDLAGLTTE